MFSAFTLDRVTSQLINYLFKSIKFSKFHPQQYMICYGALCSPVLRYNLY